MSDDPFLPPRLQAMLLLSGLAILVWFAVLGWQQYSAAESAPVSASSSIPSQPAAASQESSRREIP